MSQATQSSGLHSPYPQEALRHYDVGAVQSVQPAGGTAGKTWRVVTDRLVYFLRLRGVRTSSEARLTFDQGLRDHLLAHGVPTAASLATRDNARWLRRPEGVYELYRFVEGRSFDPENEDEIAVAARALARYHLVAASYRFSGEPEPICQYTTLGFSAATSNRMDDPELLLANLAGTAALASTPAEHALVERCMDRVRAMKVTYAGQAYHRLSGWTIHGDYTPANLLFSEDGEVAGIFDLDWAVPGARCRDMADGLYFFGCRPRDIDGSSIWSLTASGCLSRHRCAAFLHAYHSVSRLKPEECRAIPAAFAGRWLSIRLEGMAKVAPEDRFRFFARDAEAPLAWLDGHWKELSEPFEQH